MTTDLDRAKAAVEARVVDAHSRDWYSATAASPVYGQEYAVTIHILEGSPVRGIVVETNYVTFACEADGRRITTYKRGRP